MKSTLEDGLLTKTMETRIGTSMESLKTLTDFCSKKQWKPVFVALPYSNEMNMQLNKRFLKNVFYENLHKISKNDILVLDYSHDARLCSSDFYMDEEYLNERGRKLFTEIVIEDLKHRGMFLDIQFRPFQE